MTHRNGYLWLLHAWYPSEWWTDTPADRTYEPVLCSREELEEMIEYGILINHYASVEEEQRGAVTNSSLVSWIEVSTIGHQYTSDWRVFGILKCVVYYNLGSGSHIHGCFTSF